MRNLPILLLSILSILVLSCTENQAETKETSTNTKKVKTTKKSKSFNDIYQGAELKELPFVDSTNFDNFKKETYLDSDEISILQLRSIYYEIENTMEKERNADDTGWDHHRTKDDFKSVVSYKLNQGDEFKSLVVVTHLGEHEMETNLITYDVKGKYIAHTDIAYDEIAEGMLRKESKIEQHKVTTTETMWLDEKEETILELGILKTGEFAF